MASSGMLRRVDLVRTDVSDELSAYFIRVTTLGELRTTLAVSGNLGGSSFTDSCHPFDGGAMFLRNVGSYKSHTAQHPRRCNSS
jgi:hypothetical protein